MTTVWLQLAKSIALVTILALVIGVQSRLMRSRFHGPVHYEALAALAALAILCIVYVIRTWRLPLWVSVATLPIAFFCEWAAFFIGWSIVHGRYWDDLVHVAMTGWIVSTSLGCLILIIVRMHTPLGYPQ